MSGTITHKWNGTVLTITSDSGTSSADLRGEKGDTGIRGPQGATGFTIGADGSIDTSGFATQSYVDNAIQDNKIDIDSYTTKEYVNTIVGDFEANNGLTATEKNLIISILKKAAYTENVSTDLEALEEALKHSPASLHYKVTNNLTYVTTNNISVNVAQGYVYNATISAIDGYKIDKVIVTMGGADITESAYKNGSIYITYVTGDIVITAIGTNGRLEYSDIVYGNFSFVEGESLTIKAATGDKNRAILKPVGIYLTKGKTYKFTLGEAANSYYYSAPRFYVVNSGLTFEIPEKGAAANVYKIDGFSKDSVTGWTKADNSYTVTRDNIVLVVNFKNNADSELTIEDYEVLKANFKILEV